MLYLKDYEKKVAQTVKEQKKMDVTLELKSLTEEGRFAGYASVFDVVDNQRDVVQRGAFRHSIYQRIDQIKLLWQHDINVPIGYFTTIFEDHNGLYVEGQLMLELEKAREAFALLRQGVVKGLSIGYSPVRYRFDPDTGVRMLSQLDLWEISLVTFPANEASLITVVKSDEPIQDYAALDAALTRLEHIIAH